MRASLEVQNIQREAHEIAAGAGHPLTTGHVLLGMLTNRNRAAQVLDDVRLDAGRILHALKTLKRMEGGLAEPPEVFDAIDERMIETARRSGAALASSLHLLVALSREKGCIAYRAFSALGVAPVQVRTLALGRITGPVPRSIARNMNIQRAREAAYRDEPVAAVAFAEPPPAPPSRAAPAPIDEGPADHELSHSARAEAGAPEESLPGFGAVDASRAVDADPETGFELDPDVYPLLTSLGRNLTVAAALGRIDPVIGRERIIDTMIVVLNKRRSNNPCLVGDPGVGKTAIVEGLASALLSGNEGTAALRERIVVSIDVGALVAGTELRGAFSRRMARLKDEVRAADGQVIVFIDELHTLIGAGSGDGALDAANDLKAALARGEFPCIGATTREEYHRYVERDPALERRFQPIEVDEPSEEETLAILHGIIDRYEAHHGVVYAPEALEQAVRLSRRYIVDRRLPDKAINLIDTAAARAVRLGKESVELAEVAQVVSELAQVPLERLLMSDAERILGMRDYLGERVIGHDEVLDLVAEVIQRNSAGFATRRPIGSFLFLGPTGVGKTETAKVLADFLFGSKEAMSRFDMSELMERHAVSRLLGAAPGYVGHEEPGAFTAALSRRPYQILLFDEIEKAHPDVLHLLLQILDEGRLTDTKGTTLSFSSTVIVMTSNLGAETLSKQATRTVGFGGDAKVATFGPAQEKRFNEAARKVLPPELWGRIDEKCVFSPLLREDIRRIAALLITESSAQLAQDRGIGYEVSDEVLDLLVDEGFDEGMGARPMRRAIRRLCETAVARAILKGEATGGDTLQLVREGDAIVVG